MYQMTQTESKALKFETGATIEKAIKSFNEYGYLRQEGYEIQPCKYFKDRWQILYKGEYYNYERYTTLKEAMVMYLECVASMVCRYKKVKGGN